jgi:eukaryotic-like serine/threonine-protein kinase
MANLVCAKRSEVVFLFREVEGHIKLTRERTCSDWPQESKTVGFARLLGDALPCRVFEVLRYHADTYMPPRFALQPGEVIAGKYIVEAVVGQGGMGLVARARHQSLGNRVAIKIMTQSIDDEANQRFLQEARASAVLQSDHIGRVFDAGQLPDGRPFMVMEFLEGRDLHMVRKQYGKLPVSDVTMFMRQACEALSEAHELGIIHRDLKPANLFLTYRRDGTPWIKVIDFGISKIDAGSPVRDGFITTGDQVLGTPYYMSPEQIRSTRDADARSDIWSLGVIMFELCTGRLPFDAKQVTQLAHSIVLAPIIKAIEGEVREPMQSIILRCLEKNPSNRFQTVDDLREALEDGDAPVSSLRDETEMMENPLYAEAMEGVHASSLPPARPALLPATIPPAARPCAHERLQVPYAPAPPIVQPKPAATPKRIWPLFAVPAALCAVAGTAVALAQLNPMGMSTPTPTMPETRPTTRVDASSEGDFNLPPPSNPMPIPTLKSKPSEATPIKVHEKPSTNDPIRDTGLAAPLPPDRLLH